MFFIFIRAGNKSEVFIVIIGFGVGFSVCITGIISYGIGVFFSGRRGRGRRTFFDPLCGCGNFTCAFINVTCIVIFGTDFPTVEVIADFCETEGGRGTESSFFFIKFFNNGSADCAGTCFIGYGERRNFLEFKSVCFGSKERYHCDDEHHCKK
jgi:hypothetical protein